MLRFNRWFVFLLTWIASVAMSQESEKVKRLQKQLPTAAGQQKFDILCQLSWEFRIAVPDSSLYYSEQAYALGKKNGLPGIAEPLNLMGLTHYHKGNMVTAYEYFTQALSVSEQKRDSAQIGHSHNNLGRILLDQAMMPRSIFHLNQAKQIFSSISDTSGLAFAHQNIGNYHRTNHAFAEAQEQYKLALKLRESKGVINDIVSTLLQLGRLYSEEAQFEIALRYFLKSDSVGSAGTDKLLKADILVKTSECYLHLNQIDAAQQTSEAALKIINEINSTLIKPQAHLILGQVELKKGNAIAARNLFLKTIDLSQARRQINTRMEAYYFLWQSARKNYGGEAFEFYNSYMALKDSVRNLDAQQRESQLKFQLEIERKDAENAVLKAKEDRKNFIIFIQVLLILSVAAFALSLIRGRWKIMRMNRQLDKKNQEFEKVNEVLATKTLTLENHLAAILDFSKNRSIAVGNLKHAAKDIAAITAKKLEVSRVSIWVYSQEKKSIETIALYDLGSETYLPSLTLNYHDAPQYFEFLNKERIVVADNARTHSATEKFSEHYLVPNNIYSMLDATFSLDGKLKGVLCCEQLHAPRHWTMEDKLFVTSVADIITLAFRTAQRLEYERHIKQQNREIAQMNEVLEERVQQRTLELEEQNKKLTEYAFINSHMLRGPVSRILGLIHLIQKDPVGKDLEFMEHLRKSSHELDEIVKKITSALNEGNQLSIEELKKYNPE